MPGPANSSPINHGPNGNRVAALDYLRGAAAVCVAIPHFFVYHAIAADAFEAASALGVEIFFVLSGYVLASQLLYVMSEHRPRLLGIFLVRRWMRTVPAYLMALCLMSLLLGRIGDADFYRYVFYVQNLFRQGNNEDYFAVAWSLSVEEWFYLVFPLVLLLAAAVSRFRNVRTTAIAAAIVFIALISLCRLVFPDMENWGPAARRVVVFRLDSIAFGFLLYVVLQDGRWPLLRALRLRTLAVALAVLAAATFCLVLAASADVALAKHLFSFAASLFGGCCILIAIRFENVLAAAPRAAAVGIACGTLSYSIYLFHSIILIVLGSAVGSEWLPAQFLGYAIIVTTFAAVFYHTFEKPILALRPSYRSGRHLKATMAPVPAGTD
jgi:peptidoglycan/LPS O-acetylase OafA/YrhL